LDAKTNIGKPSLLIDRPIERMVRVGITLFMGRYQMVADYVTRKMYENQEVSDSNSPSNVMKIVEILKKNQLLRHHDLQTTIKTVRIYFLYAEENKYIKEITKILEVIAFIYNEIKLHHMCYIFGYQRHTRFDRYSSER